MKRYLFPIAMSVATLICQAQTTMNVTTGNGDVTTQYDAATLGDMTFSDATSVTIADKTYAISDISSITINDESAIGDNKVNVAYDGTTAKVVVAGNVAPYITATVDGAFVSIVQSDDLDDDTGKITYTLTGSTTNGQFLMEGNYKMDLVLNGVTLTNATSGPAIYINDGKKINITVADGTTNTLADAANGTDKWKGCIRVKGHTELKGNGTLNINGNSYNGFWGKEYLEVKNCTLNINAANDGINVNQYFSMAGGSVTINSEDDGIQVSFKTDDDDNVISLDEDEDNTGACTISGGTINVTSTGTATKCIKSESTVTISGGDITLNAQGALDITDISDPSYPTGVKAYDAFVQSGGTINITVTGNAGRGVAAESALTMSDGTLTVVSTGKSANSSSDKYCLTGKCMKAGKIAVSGGTINATTSGEGSKGLKSDADITITSGTITVTTTGSSIIDYDEKDAKGCSGLNADGNINISGGTLTLKSSGTGGKCIKADGTLTVSSNAIIDATSTGSNYSSGSYSASAKAIKIDGAITMTGGTVTASASSHEAIESKKTIEISGGEVYAYSSDDAINAASTFTISGGYVMGFSSGNDGLDANGNFYITGGTVYAVGTSSPELAIDANTEGGYKLYIQGGTIVAVGGLESGAQLNYSCYQASSYSQGTTYGLYKDGSLALAFTVPSSNRMGTPLVVCTTGTTTLKSGITVSGGTTLWNGYGVTGGSDSGGTSVSLSSYSGGNSGGPGGGGNQPGGGGGFHGGGWH